MSSLVLLLLALTGAETPAQTPAPEAPKPEVVLFSRAVVVGFDWSEGFGLAAELGAPGSLADVVDATLLFEHRVTDKRTFPTTSVAPQQIRAAVEAQATLVIALDYLIPYVYAETGGEEGRRASLELALRTLETVPGPLVLGDIPDLSAALTAEKPILFAKQMPSAAGLKAVNDRLYEWAILHKNVSIAPVAQLYAAIKNEEAFSVRRASWPKSWLSELVQRDRMHTRLHGTIAAWLLALDGLCTARRDLDAQSFDWSPLAIYHKVYASKELERQRALAREIDERRLPANRPPPPRPPPPGVRPTPEEEMREKLEGSERGEAERAKKRDRAKEEKEGKDGG